MKNYIFLNTTIANLGGAELYISHKCEHLKNLGYNVYVFTFEPGVVKIENLKEYQQFLTPELKVLFRRSNSKVRNMVLTKFKHLNLKGDTIIESNIDNLNSWGEFIAKEIGAYHICYLLPEVNRVIPQDIAFYDFKYKNHQLFGILENTISNMMNNGRLYCNSRLAAVGCSVGTVAEGANIELLGYKDNGMTILSLGRLNKPYITSMLSGVEEFVLLNHDKHINLIIVGGYMMPEIKKRIAELSEYSNLSVIYLNELNPIPQNVFAVSDVAIAVAGCARICGRQGIPTITIDANDLEGIGIYNYTTTQTVYRKDEHPISVRSLLDEILIKKHYSKMKPLKEVSIIDYAAHDALLQMPQKIDYFPVSHKPDSLVSYLVKMAIIVLGFQLYYKIVGLFK